MSRRKNGEGTWGTKNIKGVTYQYFRKTYDGMDKPKEFYAKTIKELKIKIKEFEQGEKPKTKNEVDKTPFIDYIRIWLKEQKSAVLKRGTYDSYEDLIKHYVEDFDEYNLGDKQMGQIDETVIQSHINALAKKYSRGTIIKAYVVINQCIKYAIQKGHIRENIRELYHMPSEDVVARKKREILFLENDDIDKLFNEAHRVNEKGFVFGGKIGEPVYGNNAYIIILILTTGIRRGEAFGLRWKDIDFEKRTLSVNSSIRRVKTQNEDTDKKYVMYETSPKTKSSIRVVPLSDMSIWALRQLFEASPNKAPDSYVCTTRNGGLATDRNLRRTLNSMLVRSGCSVQTCSLHALRHSFGSAMLYRGVDIKVVSALLGHKDISVTYNIYIHLIEEQKIEAVNVFSVKKEEHQ